MLINVFKKSILAGMFISIGAIAYLTFGNIVGAILFTFGLISILHYKLPLFTGTAGFISKTSDLKNLAIILVGNIVGCLIFAILCKLSLPVTALTIVSSRLTLH